MAYVIALANIAAHCPQKIHLSTGFYTFGNDIKFQRVPHRDDSADNGHRVRLVACSWG